MFWNAAFWNARRRFDEGCSITREGVPERGVLERLYERFEAVSHQGKLLRSRDLDRSHFFQMFALDIHE